MWLVLIIPFAVAAVPPKKPIIMDQDGVVIRGLIGPYNEGDSLFLVCETEGGSPTPTLTWWEGGVLVDDGYSVNSDGEVKNELVVTRLNRENFMDVITCQASNDNISKPLSTSIKVDMNLRPLNVSIEGIRRPLPANKAVRFACHTTGSQPPAVVTWWKGNTKVENANEWILSDGNTTTSILSFTPTAEDNGTYLICRVEHPFLKGSAIEDGWKLEVYVPPTKPLIRDQDGVVLEGLIGPYKERDSLFLICETYGGNPTPSLTWWRDDLLMEDGRYSVSTKVFVRNKILIPCLKRKDFLAEFTCKASNSKMTVPLVTSVIVNMEQEYRVKFNVACASDVLGSEHYFLTKFLLLWLSIIISF